MDLDLSLNEELGEAGKDKLLECLAVMQSHWAGCSATNVRKRKDWSELLNDLEKIPLKFQINEIRREIPSMWDKCFKSDKEREEFPEYSSDDYSQHLLVKHREVLEKLEAFYIQHRELIDLVHNYENAVSIQEQSQNPERLFNNRGARLLKEEKDRKQISKIPHMQSVILKAIKEKEAEGTLFLIRGEEFSSIIERHNLKASSNKRSPLEVDFKKIRWIERNVEKGKEKTVYSISFLDFQLHKLDLIYKTTNSALMGSSAKRSRTPEHGTSSGHTPPQSHPKVVCQLQMK